MKRFMSEVLVLLVVSFSLVTSQRLGVGQCQNVQVQQNFDVQKFTGLWYEVEKNPVSFEVGLKCVTARYTSEGDHVKVVNSGTYEVIGLNTSITGKATIPDKQEPAKLQISLEYVPFSAPLWVLDTNYDEYAVVYSCVDVIILKAEYVWIFSRQPTLDKSTKEKIYKMLHEKNIDTSYLMATTQDC